MFANIVGIGGGQVCPFGDMYLDPRLSNTIEKGLLITHSRLALVALKPLDTGTHHFLLSFSDRCVDLKSQGQVAPMPRKSVDRAGHQQACRL